MIYSHTNLSLWRLCKRRWWHRYVLGEKEPQTPVMLFSIYMIHEVLALDDVDWDAQWSKFKACPEVNNDFSNTLLCLDTAKRLKRSFDEIKVELGKIVAAEQMFKYTLVPSTFSFQSKPDLVIEKELICATVDFKFVTSNWPSAKRPWPLKPLSPFDDQLLGQALAVAGDTGVDNYQASKFIRVSFQGDRKSGNISGPIIEERCVDLALASEWNSETIATIEEIERWSHDHRSHPKNDQACNAFGKPCSYLAACKNGFQGVQS